MWTWPIFLRLLIWSCSSSVSRKYVNLVNIWKIFHLTTGILFTPPGCTWTWAIVLRPPIWSSSSSVSRKYMDLIICFKTSHLIIFFTCLQRVDVNLVNCLRSSCLITWSSFSSVSTESHSRWTWSIILRPQLIIFFQKVHKLDSIVWSPLVWSTLFVHLQEVSKPVNYFGLVFDNFPILLNIFFFSPSCMSFTSFIPPSINWQFILCSYSPKREIPRPIDVGAVQ